MPILWMWHLFAQPPTLCHFNMIAATVKVESFYSAKIFELQWPSKTTSASGPEGLSFPPSQIEGKYSNGIYDLSCQQILCWWGILQVIKNTDGAKNFSDYPFSSFCNNTRSSLPKFETKQQDSLHSWRTVNQHNSDGKFRPSIHMRNILVTK